MEIYKEWRHIKVIYLESYNIIGVMKVSINENNSRLIYYQAIRKCFSHNETKKVVKHFIDYKCIVWTASQIHKKPSSLQKYKRKNLTEKLLLQLF